MRILFLCHNHPVLQPGGTEMVARGIFRELRDHHAVEGLFLGAVTGAHRERRPGTMLQAVGGATDEMLVWLGHFDRFFVAQPDTYGLATLASLFRDLDPDIVHIHHLLLFGTETIDLLRRTIPRARLVFTAHDFFPICPQEGQLLTTDGRLCRGPSLDACQRCFPGRPAADFVMRELQLRDGLAEADRILLPSRFARDRYLAAGWPEGRLHLLPNGTAALPPAPHRTPADGRRDRFGFFGHINRFKGALNLLRASRLLTESGVAHDVALNGGSAYQSDAFLDDIRQAFLAAPATRDQGPYAPGDLPGLMAQVDWVVMPSVWWENAPLVVLEAFRHRRPVICGDFGGMAEMVADGQDGLHVPPGDPAALARTMRRAIETPGLWEGLVDGIRPPVSVTEAARLHLDHYHDVLAGGVA
jgi:glycosyltransferase involved in cell wall biosynthesis